MCKAHHKLDKPQINVTSAGSIVLNSMISSLSGDVNLSSTKGSIVSNNISNTITADNIVLSAINGDIGSKTSVLTQPIQVDIYGAGKLTANAKNVYLNY